MYVCGNPWLCNSALEWFRIYLRENVDIDIDKPGCAVACVDNINGCPPVGTPLRAMDYCPANDIPLPLTRNALSFVGWIILGWYFRNLFENFRDKIRPEQSISSVLDTI